MPALRYVAALLLAIAWGCDVAGTNAGSAPSTLPSGGVTSRPANLADIEFAMQPGQTITAVNSVGTISIRADDWLKRSYSWEGATRSVEMWPRKARWLGNLGIYFPGPGEHWEEHHGITRGVLQEGQRDFESVEQATDWIHTLNWAPYVYRNDGLLVSWAKNLQRKQLYVDVWQITIQGKKPTRLPGATDEAIQLSLP